MKNRAVEHNAEMRKKYSLQISEAIKNSEEYGPTLMFDGYSIALPTNRVEFVLYNTDSVSCLLVHEAVGKTALLNFASYTNPGGGYMKGATAQEECLCHESFLYDVLSAHNNFYEWNKEHRNNGHYLNRAIYSKGIYFERENEEKICDVLTCASPNVRDNMSESFLIENEVALEHRIKFIKYVCEIKGVETLIAGAFGCGAFGQNPKRVARLFHEIFKESCCIKEVVLAIPSGNNNYPAFLNEFVSK